MRLDVLSRVVDVFFVGMGNEWVQVETRVGWPAPNWNDWKADATKGIQRGMGCK